MEKKVSIIMGIYNCANTLPEALDSIINQTYKNWELILCDDGSKDDTYNIAKKYKEKYGEKVLLLKNNENKGLNYTLNHCLEYAAGEYIARMDGDDISLPTRLQEEVDFLDKNSKYAIVSTPMMYFDEAGVFKIGKGKGEPNVKNFAKGTPFCHATCLVRKDAFDAVNGYTVSKKRLRVEDWDLWIRMYEKGYIGFVLEKPLYKMRDDRNAYARRKFKFRINEARVSASAVKRLNLSFYNYIWVLRPILVGLLPKHVYMYLHKKKTGG